MADKRLAQINELIRQELGNIFSRELELPLGCLATISRVDTSADLEHARIWIKVFPFSQAPVIFKIILKNQSEIKRLLSHQIILKFMPSLTFKLDKSEEKASRINELINQIHHQNGS